jgi:hypothetical protein
MIDCSLASGLYGLDSFDRRGLLFWVLSDAMVDEGGLNHAGRELDAPQAFFLLGGRFSLEHGDKPTGVGIAIVHLNSWELLELIDTVRKLFGSGSYDNSGVMHSQPLVF